MSGHTRGSAGRGRGRRSAPHAEEHEGGEERWLVTYADMLTLLLVLFIVLFSISVVNVSKFNSLKSSLSAAFGSGTKGVTGSGSIVDNSAGGGSGIMPNLSGSSSASSSTSSSTSSTSSTPASGGAAQQAREFAAIQAKVTAALSAAGLTDSVRFSTTARGLVITVITDDLVFGPNSAVLLSQGTQILSVVAPALNSDTRGIEVDGYTNQQNVSTAPYPSGWELSAARACSVVRDLIADGVNANRLSARGFSDQDPLYPPSDPRAATLNRRVAIVVLSNTAN